MAKIIDGIEHLNDDEHDKENELIEDLEALLDKHMVQQEDLVDGFVIDVANEILHGTDVYKLESVDEEE